MGDPQLDERLPALWRCIEHAHYVYLEIDDSPEKLQQRKKLEGYIMEYLSLVPHGCKFGLSETGKVFQRTINELSDFSAYRAGLGWAALGRYASNLLVQPWRKEYKTIRLYSGYFKHEIEANIVGSELLLQQMGYKPSGAGRMTLDGPVCPDMVAAISRDALIAHVECQIMVQVWEAVWGCGETVSWSDVARERSRRCGDATDTASRLASQLRGVPYRDNGQEIYSNLPEPQHRTADPRHICNHIDDSPIEEPIIPMVHPSYHPQIIPNVYQIPPHLSEIPVTMNQCNQIPVMTPYGTVPYYYTPVPTPYMVQAPIFAAVKHASTVPLNGYHQPLPQYKCPAVPTAQLIEFDGPNVYENGHRYNNRVNNDLDERHARKARETRISTKCFSDISSTSLPRSDTQPALSKAREDGMGTYESWDYVFRNLSSKDHDERNSFSPSLDRDSKTLDRFDRDERRSRYQPTTLDLEDGLQALNVDHSYDDALYRTAKVNENLMKIKQDVENKKAKQLAKKQSVDERQRRKLPVPPVGNPNSDGLVNQKTAPDKVRLLTKKDVKDRKDVLKQQNSVNGALRCPSERLEVKKVRKPTKSSDIEKPVKLKSFENGLHGVAHGSKSTPGSSNASHQSSNHNYDAKVHLIVSLDETDTSRKTQSKQQNCENERPNSRNSTRHNGINGTETPHIIKTVQKWECATCTYINGGTSSACEMCGKSRNVGPEVLALTSGGRECPTCTLVNTRDATVCEACESDLKHCPTYI